MEDEMIAVLMTVIIAGLIISVLFIILSSMVAWAKEIDFTIDDRSIDEQFNHSIKNDLITQSKKHTIDYSTVKKTNKDLDFDVDFNVDLKGSIVKTEVVYAD